MLSLNELLTDCQSSYFASVALLTSLKSQGTGFKTKPPHRVVNKQPPEPGTRPTGWLGGGELALPHNYQR